MSRLLLLALSAGLLAAPVGSAPVPKLPAPPPSWPMFGGTPSRNMVNPHEKLNVFPKQGPQWDVEEDVKKWEAEWVLWKAEISYGGWHSPTISSPIVAGGRVYIGSNNERVRNVRDSRTAANGEVEKLDKGILLCFDEKTGQFLWQAVHDKLPGEKINDWPKQGLCSTPTVVGDRVYYVSNQCRVVCLDANGFADGNQGTQNEKYKDATDADIIWEYDMIRELKVFPHKYANCSPLVVGDRIFVCTTNGVDQSFLNVPSPEAPTLICLDRHTGKLLWKDNSPGKNIMSGQWSSPSYATEPVPQVIHGQGDGWLRAFDPTTGKLLWQFDGNRKGAKYELGGTGEKNDFIAMPVVSGGRVYIGTGQEPEHSTGIAHLWCIDLKKAVELGAKAPARDVSPDLLVRVENQNGKEESITRPNPSSALAWVHGGEERRKWAPRDFKFGRTLSTVAVVDDLVYVTEVAGYLHCLNANTGDHYWQYDTIASIRNSPYYLNGKVLVAPEDGYLRVFRHDQKPKTIDGVAAAGGAADLKAARLIHKAKRIEVEKEYLLAKVEIPHSILSTPTVVNGVLYVATDNTLYAIKTR